MKSHRTELLSLLFLLALTARHVQARTANPALLHRDRPNHATTIAQLQQEIKALQHEVETIKARQNHTWMNRRREAQVRRIIKSVLQESTRQSQELKRNTTAGYDHGFFIRTPDHNFRLNIRGYVQVNYFFASSRVVNAQNIDTRGNPAGPPAVGDASGFNLRRARLLFSGYLLNPQLIYEISGDFAGSSNTNGYLQLKTTYAGYKINRAVILRAGVLRVPFTYLSDYPVTGDDFGSFPLISVPFNAERSTGLDLSGRFFSNHLNYDMQINNGSKASNVGNAIDNRFGYYLRVQWSGGAKIKQFRTEASLHEYHHLAWMFGAGVGYESQNSTAGAFPSPQTSLSISGLSTPNGAGFYPRIPANGSLYRATGDVHVKYDGLNASTTIFFQQYNDRPPAGASTDNFATAFGQRSVFEVAYYGELGYFLVPRRWQIIGRAGELLTGGGDKQMFEYGLGLNWYIYGRNARVQTALIYVPNASALASSSTRAIINAQNLISMLQFQLKF